MSRLGAWFRDWIKRNIIDDDPHEPEPTHGPDFDGRYYADDEADGLNEWTRTPGGGLINQAAFDHMAHAMFGDRK